MKMHGPNCKNVSEVFERLNVTVYYRIKNIETGINYATG
jgi:hypothetical protein